MPYLATNNIMLRLLLLCAIVSLSACSSLSNEFKDPQIHLIKVELVRAKMLEQQFNLYFRLKNPNNSNLEISDLSYRVYLNEIELATGRSTSSISIPANGERIIRVPVRTNLWRHLKQVIAMLERPDQPVTYRLEGKAEVGSWFSRTMNISRTAEFIPDQYLTE